MTFNNLFYDVGGGGLQWSKLAKEASVRLLSLDPDKLSTEASLSIAGSAAVQGEVRRSAQALAQVQTINTNREIAVEAAGFSRVDRDLRGLKTVESVNLGVNIAQTAILATGLAALYTSVEKHGRRIDAHLESLRRLSLDQRMLLKQQLETNEQILHVLQQSRRNEAQQLFAQGEKLVAGGYSGDAVERYEKALEFDATDTQVLFALARARIKTGKFDRARDAFQRAATFSAEGPPHYAGMIWREYARFLAASGSFGDAIAALLRLRDSWTADDAQDVTLYLLEAERFDEARAAITDQVNRDFLAIARYAIEPRVQGARRVVLDLWLEQLCRQFAKWHGSHFATVRRYLDQIRGAGDGASCGDAVERTLGTYFREREDLAGFTPGRVQELAQGVSMAIGTAKSAADQETSFFRSGLESSRDRLRAGDAEGAALEIESLASSLGVDVQGGIPRQGRLMRMAADTFTFCTLSAFIGLPVLAGLGYLVLGPWGALACVLLGTVGVAKLALLGRKARADFVGEWQKVGDAVEARIKAPAWLAVDPPPPLAPLTFRRPDR